MSKAETDTVTGNRPELLVKLQELQAKHGSLSREHLVELAGNLDVPLSEVFGVATFYSFLATRPQGRHVIRVCRSLPCYLQHSEPVIAAVRGELGIEPGQTTADGRFSLELVNCIGACDRAPAMLVDDDVHGELTPEKIAAILQSYE